MWRSRAPSRHCSGYDPNVKNRESPQSPALEVGLRDPRRYLPEMEALRGIAILLVALFHAAAILSLIGDRLTGKLVSPLTAYVAAGHTGVGLFFVLSAFLLSQPFLAERDPAARVRRTHFYQRRALRILPLYYAWVVLTVAVTSYGPSDWLRGIPYLFFLQSIHGMTEAIWPYTAVWWSLATEFQFYLLLPLLGWSLRSVRGRWLGGIGLILYALAYVAFLNGHAGFGRKDMRMHLGFSLFGQGPIFLAGIGAAWIHTRYGAAVRDACARRAWLRNGGADVVLLGVVLLFGMMLQRVVFAGFWTAEQIFPSWHVVEGVAWAAVVLIVLLLPLRLRPLIASRPLQLVGVVSYSMYLCHLPLFEWLIRFWTSLGGSPPGDSLGFQVIAVAGLVLVAIGVSAVTYAVIERPFLMRKAQVSD